MIGWFQCYSFDHLLGCRWVAWDHPLAHFAAQLFIGSLFGEGTCDCNSIQTTLCLSCNFFPVLSSLRVIYYWPRPLWELMVSNFLLFSPGDG